MAGLRIRWRRESAERQPTPAAIRDWASSGIRLGVFVWVAAVAILVLAGAVRLYNVSWDENTHLHPDERHLTTVANDVRLPASVSGYFDSAHSKLNPYNRPGGGSFVYGTLPLFLTKASAAALDFDNYDQIVLVGRHLSAIFDLATVAVVFLIGRRLYGALAGLAGALLYASAPLAVQHAHFFVTDPFLTFFTAAVLYFSVRIVQEGGWSDYALAGLALGLGMACKVTAVVVVPVIVVAALVRLWPLLDSAVNSRRLAHEQLLAFRRPLLALVLAGIVSFLAFRVAQPYAFQTPSVSNLGIALDKRWTDDQKQQSKLLGGEIGFPPSVQWIGRASYTYPLREMVEWGMGPAFGIAGWLAFAYAAFRLLLRRDVRHLLPVVFVFVYFGFMGRQFSLYMRYFLPLYPVLAVLAGYALVELTNAAGVKARRLGRPALQTAAYAVGGLVLALSLVAGLAYLNIYRHPITRLQASRDLYQELPDGARIATEHWDDPVPGRLPGSPDKQFRLFELTLYELDTREKVTKLINDLNDADYITISSTRLTDSIPRNPINYPTTSRYYRLLFNGDLGFRLMRTYTSYPSFLGIQFPDDKAQESWSSYDHPRVLVFEKTPEFSRQHLITELGTGPFVTGGVSPRGAEHQGLLLDAGDLQTQRRGGMWTSVFNDSGLAHSHPALLWLLALEVTGFAVLPLVGLLCRRLPDRGYLLAKPLGLLVLVYIVWLATTLHITHFTQPTILVALLGMTMASGAVLYRKRDQVAGFVRSEWKLILFCEIVFLAAFFFFLELRMLNPDLWHPSRGGEKPMDLAYLTAVARSTTLPPYDPWFAGGYINYYYFGQVITATLLKLTTIPPELAFNLAIPTYFAMTAAGAFSVAYNLAAAGRRYLRRAPGLNPIPRWSAYVAGVLGAFFVTVAGNLDGLVQLSDRLSKVSKKHIDTSVPLLDSVINGFFGLVQVVFHGAHLQPFDFWRSSRMLPPTISITEFPYFSFLFADLHAHLMALGFEVLTLGLCVNLVLGRPGGRRDWQEWATIPVLGLVVGSLRWINSWDYPPFLLIAGAAILIGERRVEGGLAPAATRTVGKLILLGASSFLFFKPFLDSYQTPVTGLQPSPETTPLHQYLAHFGIFAAVIGAWLLFLLLRSLRRSLATGAALRSQKTRNWLEVAAIWLVAIAVVDFALILRGHTFVAVLVSVLALVGYLALDDFLSRRPDAGLRLFVLALVGLGLGLCAGVDLVTLKGDIVRMNTVFKFYLHTWIVFAIAASFAAWQLVFVVWWPSFRPVSHVRPVWRFAALGGLTALALLVISAAIYPIFATKPRLHDRFVQLPKTLDGTAYMRNVIYADGDRTYDLAADWEGIQWMRENVRGTPAIVEGRTELYKWGSRFSIYTGLPDVLGWDWHQKQQRGDLAFMVDQRATEVQEFYQTPSADVARAFLRRYDVQYVILGQVERYYYSPDGLRKFDSGLAGALDLVFANSKLRIYHVRPETVTQASASAPSSP